MQTLSALDAISPALARTKLVFFKSFCFRRTWKLAMTVYLAKGGLIFLPLTLLLFSFLPLAKRHGGWLAAIGVLFGVPLITALYYFLFSLCSRLQFVAFDIIASRETLVAPAWRKYKQIARHWTVAKAIVGTSLTAVIGIPITAYGWHLASIASKHATSDLPPALTVVFVGLWFLLFFGSFLLLFAFMILSDFIIPALALEDATLSAALKRFGQVVRKEPGAVLAYVLIKAGIGFFGQYAVLFGLEIAYIVVACLLFLIGLALGFLIHLAGVPWDTLQIVGAVTAFPLMIAFMFCVLPTGLGIFMAFLDAYGIYFLGGRYPLLGDLLDRTTPYPPLPNYYDGPLPPQSGPSSAPPL